MKASGCTCDATRERILACGKELLLRQGLHAITTNAIAASARISKTTLYNCFTSKETLVCGIAMSVLQKPLRRWDAILDREGIVLAVRIEQALVFQAEFLSQLQACGLTGPQLALINPELRTRIDTMLSSRFRRLEALIREAQAEGLVRTDLNPELWSLLLLRAIEGALAPTSPLSEEPGMLQALTTIYFRALLAARGKSCLQKQRGTGCCEKTRKL